MKKISTQLGLEERTRSKLGGIRPSEVTVNLLKQFARIYNYDPTAQPLLRTLIPN